MPTYSYTAKHPTGESVNGTLTAENERIVLGRLDEMGLFPLKVELADVAEEAARSQGLGGTGRVKRAELCVFTHELADLLAGGVPLARGLETLGKQSTRGVLGAVLTSMKNELASGRSFADALAMHPQIFPQVYVNMVRAGEEGGFLDDALLKLADFLDREHELIGRVRSAMAYPILLVLVGFATVAFLVTFAVPTLAQTFADMGGAMPLPTIILMKFSDALREQGPVLAAAAVVVLLVGIQILRTERGRRWLDVAKLRTPALGRVYQKLAISRFARTLGTLLDSGVPILNALALAEGSTGNRIYAEAIAAAAEDVRAGESLAPQLQKSRCFPPMVIDMMAIGEESGNLGGCLVRLADRNERDLDNALRIFVSLLEPCILIVLGAFVLFIVLAMLLPVFTMSTLVM